MKKQRRLIGLRAGKGAGVAGVCWFLGNSGGAPKGQGLCGRELKCFQEGHRDVNRVLTCLRAMLCSWLAVNRQWARLHLA